jgi:hypothetical protein
MTSEVQGAFVNYYELLGVAENASSLSIQAALNTYRESLEAKMNNPLSMGSARAAMNEIVPAIEHYLLSGDSVRAEYDRQVAESRKKQTEHYEPADDEALDDSLRIPFLFNPFEDFDTEIPGYTLRLIAMKLDSEWAQARAWITDTSDETHGFISYLTFVANRKQLAGRIGDIISAVSQTNGQRMDTNEGIERCIDILDPHIERPRVGIHNPTFDGKTLDAGTFITDLPAQFDLILGNEGVRGCAFGVVESRTSWVAFAGGQSTLRFALMPEGTEPEIGASEIIIPLFFDVTRLARDRDHTALLVIHMENQAREVELHVHVVIHVQPLPPRVVFEPEATPGSPAWAGITRRGVPTRAVVMPRNYGDEGLIPLAARISAKDNAARAEPGQFRANQPVTLTIDTSSRPFGQKYTVPFTIDYITPGTQGPAEIYVQGETLPTVRQSMFRERSIEGRVGLGCGVGFVSLILLGALGAGLATHTNLAWLFFLAIPIVFALATRSMVSTTVAHMQRAGNTQARMEQIAPWKLWGIPIAIGLVVALVCTLIPDTGSSFFIGGLIGFILGFALGFMLDRAQPVKTNVPVQGD